MREGEKSLETSSDVDRVWGEWKTSGVALLGSMLARTERRNAKLSRP